VVQIATKAAFIMLDVLLSNYIQIHDYTLCKNIDIHIHKIREGKKVLALQVLLFQNSAYSFDIEFHKSTEPIQIKHHENEKSDSS